MNETCPKCGTERKSNALFCEQCGNRFQENCPGCHAPLDAGARFCSRCGYKLDIKSVEKDFQTLPYPPTQDPPQALAPEKSAPVPDAKPSAQQPRSKKKMVLLLIILIGAILILSALFILAKPYLFPEKRGIPADLPAMAEEEDEAIPPQYSYEAKTVIHSALYNRADYVIYFKGSSEKPKDMLLTVEVPGFTQKFEQKITLIPQVLKMKIRPPMLERALDQLNTTKESQIKVTLQDMENQKYLIQDSKPVTLLSKYDMKWVEEDGSESYYENIAAWVTPEAPEIKDLLRKSINTLSKWSNGAINEIVGYQPMGEMDYYDITYFQVAAIFDTLKNTYKVRYNATPVTTSGNGAQQRVALPEDVINQKSGLCIETAVTMASAIEATGMHPMILILPSHAQVAVELWKDKGEYLLLETTALTEPDWNNIMGFLDREQWNNYLVNSQVTVIDIELARKDGIKPMK